MKFIRSGKHLYGYSTKKDIRPVFEIFAEKFYEQGNFVQNNQELIKSEIAKMGKIFI